MSVEKLREWRRQCIWTRRYCHDFVSSCRPGWLTPHLDGCRHREDVDDAITKINFCKLCGDEITFDTVEYDKNIEKISRLKKMPESLNGRGCTPSAWPHG